MTPRWIKLAVLSLEMENPISAGRSIANIIKFLLNRIPIEYRQKMINNMRYKILALNPMNISIKTMPPTAALGQGITFIKTVLQGKPTSFISSTLKEISKAL